jgi:hypothetical protein
VNLSITAEARDALYDHILGDLSGIGDVWTVVCAENFEAAERLGRQYSDELRLILDDLGWGGGTGETVELTTPPDVLRRVFRRLLSSARGLLVTEQQQQVEVREFHLVAEVCERLLTELDDEQDEGSCPNSKAGERNAAR